MSGIKEINRKNEGIITSGKGFTLIEMLIVIAIIGILASMVLVGLGPVQRRGRDARRISDLKQVQNALELYYNKCGFYPGSSSGCATIPSEGDVKWDALSKVLTDAANTNIGVNQIPDDPSSNRSYYYGVAAEGASYVLAAELEDSTNPALLKSPKTDLYNVGCSKPNYYCIQF